MGDSLTKQQTNPLREMTQDLREFWSYFDPCGPSPGQCTGKCRSKEVKLELLREFAERRYTFKRRIPLAVRRASFEKAKRNRRKFKWPCFVCGAKCQARHHINELQNGGTNAKKNIIAMCHGCHAEIHPWMKDNHTSLPRSGRPLAVYKSTASVR